MLLGMCGRLVFLFTWGELNTCVSSMNLSLVADSWSLDEIPVNYNAAPTASVPVLRSPQDEQAEGTLELALLRWWLLPAWSKTPEIRYATFNAKSEGAASKPAFRGPMRRRRCVLPVNGFYEWKKLESGGKRPYYISRADGELMMLAGLWDRWVSQDGGEAIESCTVLTTTPNAEMRAVHDRMPCVLEPEDVGNWCDPRVQDAREAVRVLVPAADGVLAMHEVDPRVGNAREHNDAGLISAI